MEHYEIDTNIFFYYASPNNIENLTVQCTVFDSNHQTYVTGQFTEFLRGLYYFIFTPHISQKYTIRAHALEINQIREKTFYVIPAYEKIPFTERKVVTYYRDYAGIPFRTDIQLDVWKNNQYKATYNMQYNPYLGFYVTEWYVYEEAIFLVRVRDPLNRYHEYAKYIFIAYPAQPESWYGGPQMGPLTHGIITDYVCICSSSSGVCMGWDKVEIEPGWQMIATPVPDTKIKSIIDYLESKYGPNCIGACVTLIGGLNYRNYVPGVTPSDSPHNFPLIYIDQDLPDNEKYEEIVGYYIKNITTDTLILENIWG